MLEIYDFHLSTKVEVPVNGVLSQAVEYCQQIKDNSSICSTCIKRLCFSKLV